MGRAIKTAESIRRRGSRICDIDETIPAFVAADAVNKDFRVVHKKAEGSTGRFVEKPATVVPVVAVEAEPIAAIAKPNRFEGDAVAAAIYLLNRDAFHLLSPEIQEWAAGLVAYDALREKSGWDNLTLEAKTTIAIRKMEWYWHEDEPLGAICHSIHTPNIYFVQYVPGIDGEEGKTICDPECVACQCKKLCYHVMTFNAVWLPKILAYVERMNAGCRRLSDAIRDLGDSDTENESVHRAEIEAEREPGFVSCKINGKQTRVKIDRERDF